MTIPRLGTANSWAIPYIVKAVPKSVFEMYEKTTGTVYHGISQNIPEIGQSYVENNDK